MNLTEIQQSFHNSTVLLTGGTGFIGSLVLEKLLRSCTPKRIYLLARPKRGLDVNERIKLMFDEVQFTHVRKLNLNLSEKLVLINSDLLQPQLGLSSIDKQTLINEVNFVIHCAACIKFHEKIHIATKINIRGTRDLMNIAKEMTKLKAYVHVSTAYSNCNLKAIDDVFYEPPISGQKLIDLVEELDGNNECFEAITKPLIRDWPNTYTFTKQIAEDMVRVNAENLPICIVRPSIVVAAVREPLVGYVGNFYGLSGYILANSLGYIRVSLVKNLHETLDIIPVDMIVNNIIAAAWNTAKTKITKENYENRDIKIYNCVSSAENPMKKKIIYDSMYNQRGHLTSTRMIWYPWHIITRSAFLYVILTFLFHVIPVYLADFILFCVGRKPWIISKYRKEIKIIKILNYFTNNEWIFSNKNTKELQNKMSVKDRKLFNFDVSTIDWCLYCEHYYFRGIVVYLLKEPISKLAESKKHFKKLVIYHYISIIIVLVLFVFGYLKFIHKTLIHYL